MTMKLSMTATIVALITFISCKKDVATTQHTPNPVSESNLKVENGIIHFRDNQEFVQTMLVINSLPASKRAAWEKSNGFMSLRSKYDEFNRELDKMEAVRDEAGFYAVRDKYRDVAVWYEDSSYQINCSGIMESSVVNIDGYVRVGDNLLNFREDQIMSVPVSSDKNARGSGAETIIWKKPYKGSYHQSNSQLPAGRVGKEIYGAQAQPNSFSLSQGALAPKVTATIATGNLLFRLWNVNIDNKNMGFVTTTFWANHRNWIGISRRATSTGLGHDFQHNVKLAADGYANISYPVNVTGFGLNFPRWAYGPNWNNAIGEEVEVVILASTGLKNVSSVPGLDAFYSNQFALADQYISESGAANNYWQVYEPYLALISYNIKVYFQSLGKGLSPQLIDHIIEYK